MTTKNNKFSIENFLHNPEQKINILEKGVYKLSFNNSSDFYIGSTTKSFKTRFRRHIHDLEVNKHCNYILQSAYKKYGMPLIEILEICTKETCIEREQFYFDTLNPKYNIAKKAGNTLGVKMKTEILEKKSIKVDVFDLEGTFINTYKSISEACRALGADSSNVTKSMRNETSMSNNYQFREHGKYKNIPAYEKTNSDKVLVYSISGEFLKEFSSKLEASKELKVQISGIVKNMQGQYSSVKNYIFKNYEKNYPLLVTPYSRNHTNQKKVKITDFYTKEIFEFEALNKVSPKICYKNVLTKGLKEYKGKEFIIKNRYIVQIKAYKSNEIIGNI